MKVLKVVKKVKKADGAVEDIQKTLKKIEPLLKDLSHFIQMYIKEDREKGLAALKELNKMASGYFQLTGVR